MKWKRFNSQHVTGILFICSSKQNVEAKENIVIIITANMNFEAGLPQLVSVSDEKRNLCILTATLCRFSSFRKPGESEFTEYETNDDDFKSYFRPVFYANGDCSENEDAAGNRRFPQTLAYVFDPNSPCDLENGIPKFGFGKYLKRETLCSEFSEFLPGDCLNIYIEANYLIRFYIVELTLSVTPEAFVRDGEKFFFSLDSPFGRELRKVCDYFRRVSDTPMIENKTRRVYIPPEELKAFHHINLILMKAKEIKIDSVSDICQLYIVADKYDIQSVITTCRQLVKSFLCSVKNSKVFEHAVESIPMILELAETYSDEPLKNIILVYEKTKTDFETNEDAFEEHLKDRLDTNWNCEYEEILNSAYFKLIRTGDNDKDPEMKFYE